MRRGHLFYHKHNYRVYGAAFHVPSVVFETFGSAHPTRPQKEGSIRIAGSITAECNACRASGSSYNLLQGIYKQVQHSMRTGPICSRDSFMQSTCLQLQGSMLHMACVEATSAPCRPSIHGDICGPATKNQDL